MSQVTRYILRQLLSPFVFLTLSLAAVVWLTQSLAYVDLIINRGLSAGRFVTMTLMLTPGFLGLIMPIALFCAILYTYHRLTYDSELMVMRSAGLSHLALAAPALVLAGAVTAAGYGLSLYLTPLGFSTFKSMQFVVRTNQASVLLQGGEFNTLADGITAYVRERLPGGELRGILVHDARDPEQPVTVMAERGVLVAGDNGPRFVLFEGNRQEIDSNGEGLSLLYFERYALDLEVFGNVPGTPWREPAERFLPSLLFPEDTRDDITYGDELRAEGHYRLVAPLYALVLAVIALAAVLSGEFNRRGVWGRIAAAATGALLFEALGLGLHSLAEQSPGATVLMYLNVLIAPPAALAAIRLRHWRAPALTQMERPA